MLGGTLLIGAIAAAAANESNGRKSFTAFRTDTPPAIDGLLDDVAWLDATPVVDFHQNSPRYRNDPTEVTEVRVVYDDDFLYISADLHDGNPQEITATQLIQGRSIASDDRFFIALDSFNSKRNDYLFEVNANGIRREALREANSRLIENWTTIWHAESVRNDTGWSTEIAIPFRSISFDPESAIWGVNFGRWVIRKQEFNLWSSNQRLWWAAESGEMHGIDNVRQGLGLQVVPTVNLKQQRDITASSSATSLEPSLDVLYRITPSLNASFTVNTDFSSAEADQRQIALDRFSLFYPEKRDFFLQDAGIFEFGNIDTNGRPFFSRRIGLSGGGVPNDIEFGSKLTGRAGRLSVGILGIRQGAYNDISASNLFVGRLTANVLSESSLGVIVTHGNPISNEPNTLLGADFLYRNSDGPWGQIVQGQMWLQATDVPGLSHDNHAFGAGIGIPNDRFQIELSASEIQKNFHPALGFVNRSGIRRFESLFRNRVRPGTGHWREIDTMLEASLVTTMDGQALSQQIRLTPVSLRLYTNDLFLVEWERNRERVQSAFNLFNRLTVPVGDYIFDRYRAELSTGTQRPVSLLFSVQRGGFFGGDRLERVFEMQWRQSAHLFFGAGFTTNVVNLPNGAFTARLGSVRTDIAFNSRWSWSNLVQYDNVAEAAAVNSRLRFQPDAWREFIFILNHGFRASPDGEYTSLNNELVLKLSYTFRY